MENRFILLMLTPSFLSLVSKIHQCAPQKVIGSFYKDISACSQQTFGLSQAKVEVVAENSNNPLDLVR